MSFDVYVQWFHDGDSQGVPEERVRSAFGDALKVQDDFSWRLFYGPGLESDVYVSRRNGKVEGVMVNRPVEVTALWQALFDFLGIENAVFFSPGSGLFIRSTAVVAHLPPEMVEALGPPQVVSSAAALRHTLDAASIMNSTSGKSARGRRWMADVLRRNWDPIGADTRPEEFETYVAEVERRIGTQPSPRELAEYLVQVETERLGYRDTDPKMLVPVAKKLLRLNVTHGDDGPAA